MDNSSNTNQINNPLQPTQSIVEPVRVNSLPQVNSEVDQNNLSRFIKKVKIDNLKKNARKTGFSCLLLIGAFCALFLVYLLFFATGLDTQIIPLSFKGYVVNSSIPITNTVVKIEGIGEVTTNEVGEFYLTNLNQGTYYLTIEAPSGNFSDSFNIEKKLFQYNFSKTFDISSNQNLISASIKGKFTNIPANYSFTGEFVEYFDKKSPISVDGSFLITNVTSKEGKIVFKSSNFKDVELDLTLNDGVNEISEIKLELAGDIEGTKVSYVREKPVENFKVEASNVLPNQIEVSNDKFLIKDLTVGRSYTLRISGNGIETRTYEVNVESGKNLIKDFRLVESATSVFTGTLTARGDNQFYKSSLDGANLDQLSTTRNLKPVNATVIGDKLYFQSDFEKIDANFTISNIFPVYELDLNVKSDPKRLTTITENLGSIFPNYYAKKAINVIFDPSDTKNKRLVQVMNIDGSERKNIYNYNSDRFFQYILVSNDGTKAFFVEQVTENSQRLFRIDLKTSELSEIITREEIILYQISEDSNTVLFAAKRENSSFYTLNTFNDTTSEIRIIVNNYEGSGSLFLSNLKKSIIYYEFVNNRTNVVEMDTDGSDTVTRNIFSDGTEVVDAYTIQDYVFFLTKNTLFVSHNSTPANLKKVIESESITSSF